MNMASALFIVGCYFVAQNFFIRASKFYNIFLLKILPFFGGLYIMYYASKQLGWI